MKKQRMVLLGSLALVILLSVVLIILMTSPQQEQSQESSQTDQQQAHDVRRPNARHALAVANAAQQKVKAVALDLLFDRERDHRRGDAL